MHDQYADFQELLPDYVKSEADFKNYQIRHSCEHVFAQAVTELFPGKVTLAVAHIHPDMFANDALWSIELKVEDLPKIEKKMKQLITANLPIVREEVPVEEARKLFINNKFKTEWLEQFAAENKTITIYRTGDKYLDLCKGPHVDSTGQIKAFKLMSISGAYWRGDEKNEMLTRVYGIAFGSEEELNDYLALQEELKQSDHRKIGQEQQLFHFDEEIGAGLPIWLPRGNIIKEQLENWAKETEEKWGYQRVTTPLITKENLFYTSGHLPLYSDSMYAAIKIEEENFYLKPMNCPFHHKVFSSSLRSYRELPLRIAEYGWCHRYEDSGSLFGLMRVRGMQMNDAHIYCRMEDAVEEFIQVIKLHEYYYKMLGIKEYEMELALRDPKKMDKYHGDEADWKMAEEMTLKAMEASGVPFKVANEGAAFYGPKMDFQIKSSIGRSFTASTNQLDLYMGKRFDLQYTDQDGVRKHPAIIHRAPLGTHERFIGFLIEHFKGNFPAWLSPEQVRIVPITDENKEYAQKIVEELRNKRVRVSIDSGKDRMHKKIAEAQQLKIPYILVIGKQEEADNAVSLRYRNSSETVKLNLSDFVNSVASNIDSKALDIAL